jgi:hypothetical protein
MFRSSQFCRLLFSLAVFRQNRHGQDPLRNEVNVVRAALKRQRRSMGRLLVVLTVVSALVHSSFLTVAQKATPSVVQSGPRQGEVAQAFRTFHASGSSQIGTRSLAFAVFEFDSVENAEKAVPMLNQVYRGGTSLGTFLPTSTTAYRDSTFAFTGKVEIEGFTFDHAILIIRDGRFVHLWVASGRAANPLLDLTAVAHRLFEDTPSVDATPRSDTLLSRVPTLNDLPTGFVLLKQGEHQVVQPTGTPAS